MAKATRFAWSNLVQSSGAVIVPSSEETSLPRAALQRAGISDVLRFKTGWTINDTANDRIEFNRGGVKVAVIAAGTYVTGALLAVAIVAALEVADAGQGWACSYSGATFKFTISATPAFTLLFGSGIFWNNDSAHLDLGYTSTDKGAATSQVAENVSYQSRHSVNVDLGSAQAATAAIVRGHNVSTAGTIRMDGNIASMILFGLAAGNANYTETLAGTDPRVVFFASQSKRYLRLVIEDVQNSVGYNELGVFFAGPYSQPSVQESVQFIEKYEQLSEILYASGGAHGQVRRTRRRAYQMLWEEIIEADIALFRALDLAMPAGASWFLVFDAIDNPTTSCVYGYLNEGVAVLMQSGPYSNVPIVFSESLG